MNILIYLYRYPGFGGIEKVSTLLTTGFIEASHNVKIVSFVQESFESIDSVGSQVELYSLPNSVVDSNENLIFLKRLIQDLNIDIFIYQHSYAQDYKLLKCVKCSSLCKVIVVEHNTPDAQLLLYKSYVQVLQLKMGFIAFFKMVFKPLFLFKRFLEERIRQRFLYRNCDRYVLLSSNYLSVLKKISGYSCLCKVVSINNPVPQVSVPTLISKQKHILYVGRIDKEHKRVDRLVRIYELVANRYDDWSLLIVGDGKHRKDLQDYVVNKQIPRVFFEGYKTDVHSYYERASIFCLTSNIEGWPMVLNEAMSYGVVPISFDSFISIYDIIDNEINGFIVESFDEDKYTQVLCELIENNKLLSQMSKAAIEKSKKFSMENIVNEWNAVFKELSK
ncbi:MAG: glycosyltransferase [Breznakibacter sp.]